MSGVELDGFDELKKKLNNLKKSAEELEGEQEISFKELFSDSFIRKYTDFSTIEKLIEESEFDIETEEQAREIIGAREWDKYINNHTCFQDWEAMLQKAAEEWALDQLGL